MVLNEISSKFILLSSLIVGALSVTSLAQGADINEFFDTVDIETVTDAELDEFEVKIAGSVADKADPLRTIGRFAYFRGYLLNNLRPDLSSEKADASLRLCIKKSSELEVNKSTFVQKSSWNLFCSMQLFKLINKKPKSKAGEKAGVIGPASVVLKKLIYGDKGADWLLLKKKVDVKGLEAINVNPDYFGGLTYRALAEIYVQIEKFFAAKGPLTGGLALMMQDIIGGDRPAFRKQLCVRAKEFYKKSLEGKEDKRSERIPTEFLANYRVGAEVEALCGSKEQAFKRLDEAVETYNLLVEDEVPVDLEDDAELLVIKKLKAEFSK